MTDHPDRPISIRLSAQQLAQPEILNGLDSWLRLGLLSELQVRQFCQENLTCPLPVPAFVDDFADDFVPAAANVASTLSPSTLSDSTLSDSTENQTISPALAPASSSRPPSLVSRSLQAFMAEISVIWLLFLGVFMVVVSSGVLAASQWENFSPVGQYGILFAYTLAFWGVSQWALRRQTLQLTARMLQIATLLIIPVNFWMMDGLRLWQSFAGVIVGAIAALSLTVIILFLLKPSSELTQTHNLRLTLINSIGLSWLHWGWALPGVPLAATYVGTVGTALLLYLRADRHFRADRQADRESQGAELDQSELDQSELDQSELDQSELTPPPSQPFSILAPSTLLIAFAALLLVGRALLVAQVPLDQLGLALGTCGWLLCWLTRRDRAGIVWARLGTGLLLLGWAVTVTVDPPWQAIAVSGLGLWLLADRLQLRGGTAALTALVLVGLQTYVLLWRLLSPDFRQSVIVFATQIVGSSGMPEVLLGLAGLPYIWLMLRLANRLRRQRSTLAQQAEIMALILGSGLTLISLVNPAVRSLNLSLSALTLAAVIWHRLPRLLLIYLTHSVGLAAILSWIALGFPRLGDFDWSCVLLLGVAIEWVMSVGLRDSLWQNPLWPRSAWHLGLGLAGLSYVLLLATVFSASAELGDRTLVWLVVPALLTGLSCLRSFPHRRPLAAWLSAGALLAQLLLLNSLSAWVISLAIATGLMFVNTQTLRQLLAASLTIGFALGFEATAIHQGFAEQITEEIFTNLLAGTLWLLWLLRGWLIRQDSDLRRLYASAANGWAIALCLLALLLLSFDSLAGYPRPFALPNWQMLLAAGLTTGAIAYRIRQRPTNLGFYGIGWGIEACGCLLVHLAGGTVTELAIANLGLGLLTQVAGDVWVRQSGQNYRSSWHVVPILYAGLGLLLAHLDFVDSSRLTAYTGLYTLAAALVGIGVGRRYPALKPLTVLAVLLSSVAAYELLIYQLMQARAGSPGDGMTLLAGLAAVIAWGDRLSRRWLLPYLRLTANEMSLIGHLHWALGSSLALLALSLTLSPTGTTLWILITAGLSAYALGMGRMARVAAGSATNSISAIPSAAAESTAISAAVSPPLSSQDGWTYIGIAEALIVISKALYQAIPETALLGWAGAIAATLAAALYFLPWDRWGWSMRPWRNSAIILPAIAVCLTADSIYLQSLLITAAFYAWLAKTERQIRLSYLSIFLLDWAIVRYLNTQGWLSLLWFSVMVGGTLLYVAQVDPALQKATAREQRHGLRSLAVGLICLTALYQAEVETGTTAFWIGCLAIGLGIGLVFLGLLLRVRAFLYIGTATFILRILRLLWLFINTYSLLLWAVGIVIGLMFIWIAATFEARRSQMNALLQYWLTELENWE